MEDVRMMEIMIEKARAAQRELENYDQAGVDRLCRVIAKTIYDNAEELARLAVEETGMGVYEDKVNKNRGKARVIWNDMKGGKSVGIIKKIPEKGIALVAKPMGVIGCITPTTNPIVTPMCNAMFAVKGRNAAIICPHPRSKVCSNEAVRRINSALENAGAPAGLIQCVQEPSIELSALTMSMCDVCVSTGGASMVKAAYSSGKPAFGVGPGNVQCIIDEDADLEAVIPMVIEGRRFDNGIICSGEQTAIIPAYKIDEATEIYKRNGTFYISDDEQVAAVRAALFPCGAMNGKLVGRSAAEVAAAAGIAVAPDTKILLVKAGGAGDADDLAKEKMAPVQTLYKYDSWDEALEIARANMSVQGAGHTVSLHSGNEARIEQAAKELPASRFLVGQVCSTSCGGSFFNGLAPTTTIGCGSWGNNSLSENLSWRHLFNVSRIAYKIPGAEQPADDQIFEL